MLICSASLKILFLFTLKYRRIINWSNRSSKCWLIRKSVTRLENFYFILFFLIFFIFFFIIDGFISVIFETFFFNHFLLKWLLLNNFSCILSLHCVNILLKVFSFVDYIVMVIICIFRISLQFDTFFFFLRFTFRTYMFSYFTINVLFKILINIFYSFSHSNFRMLLFPYIRRMQLFYFMLFVININFCEIPILYKMST